MPETSALPDDASLTAEPGQHGGQRFSPSAEFRATAMASADLYADAATDRLEFWAEQSRSLLHWHRPFTEVLDWTNPPFARWFDDGELNVAYNCLDRHVLAGNGDRIALHLGGRARRHPRGSPTPS